MAALYRKPGSVERSYFRRFAYLGRYAHQPVSELLKLTDRQISIMEEKVVEIIREEMEPR